MLWDQYWGGAKVNRLCCAEDEGKGAQARRGRNKQEDVDSEDEAALDALLNEAQRHSGTR